MSVQIMLAGFTAFEEKEDIKVKIKIIAGLTVKENARWKLEFTKQRLQNWKTVIEKKVSTRCYSQILPGLVANSSYGIWASIRGRNN